MARLHYYQFPEGVDAATRAKNGAEELEYVCMAEPDRYADESRFDPSENCPSYQMAASEDEEDVIQGCGNCVHCICTDADDTIGGISISAVKELIKKFGGRGYTRHIERDGGCFETTEIKLSGNNSRHKYNRHL